MTRRARRLVAVLLIVVSSTAWPACERVAIASPAPSFVADETRLDVLVPTLGPFAGDRVSRWRDEALRAGWKASQWPRLRCIIRYESGGNPRARGDRGTSLGLLQVHLPAWRRWLIARGHIRSSSDLYNPTINLRVGRVIFKIQGWRAWTASRRCP